MRLEHLLSGDGRLSLSFDKQERSQKRRCESRQSQVKQDKTKRKRQVKKDTNLAKVTLYRADVALQTVSMGREVEALSFSLLVFNFSLSFFLWELASLLAQLVRAPH